MKPAGLDGYYTLAQWDVIYDKLVAQLEEEQRKWPSNTKQPIDAETPHASQSLAEAFRKLEEAWEHQRLLEEQQARLRGSPVPKPYSKAELLHDRIHPTSGRLLGVTQADPVVKDIRKGWKPHTAAEMLGTKLGLRVGNTWANEEKLKDIAWWFYSARSYGEEYNQLFDDFERAWAEWRDKD